MFIRFSLLGISFCNLYYINANLKAAKNGKYWVTKTNGIVKAGYQREFDAQGRMIAKNGILPLDGNGVLVYYVNDDVQYDLGLVRMADGRMIYVNADATLKANGTYYLSKTNHWSRNHTTKPIRTAFFG